MHLNECYTFIFHKSYDDAQIQEGYVFLYDRQPGRQTPETPSPAALTGPHS